MQSKFEDRLSHNQNVMILSRTKQSLKSGETAAHGDQWPMFLYAGYVYDSEDPWKGLLRSEILVFVSPFHL